MGKLFEFVIPRSETDPDYSEYEFLLRWIGRDGADYQYMFFNPEYKNSIRTNVINQKDEGAINSIISSNERDITLETNDLSENDMLIINQIMENKQVYRQKKDGTIEIYAPDRNSFKYKKADYRYSVEFTLIRTDVPVWK